MVRISRMGASGEDLEPEWDPPSQGLWRAGPPPPRLPPPLGSYGGQDGGRVRARCCCWQAQGEADDSAARVAGGGAVIGDSGPRNNRNTRKMGPSSAKDTEGRGRAFEFRIASIPFLERREKTSEPFNVRQSLCPQAGRSALKKVSSSCSSLNYSLTPNANSICASSRGCSQDGNLTGHRGGARKSRFGESEPRSPSSVMMKT